MIKDVKIDSHNIVKVSLFLLLYLITFGIIFSNIYLVPLSYTNFPIIRALIIAFASVLLTKYFLYMLVSPWHEVLVAYENNRYKNLPKTKSKREPLVSVLIPAWNEENGVVTTTKALLNSNYKNLEIIVIDNASKDKTKRNIMRLVRQQKKKAFKKNNPTLKYLYESKAGKGHALNRGYLKSRGKIIITIDADCYVPPDTISKFVRHFRNPKVMAAVGNVRIGNTKTLIGVIQYLEFIFSFYFKRADSIVDVIYIIGGAAGAYRREVFKKNGKFSTTNITEDIEFSVRIQDAGMKIVYASDAIIYTEGANTLSGLMKQRLRWKRGRLETFLEHRHLFFSKHPKHNKLLSWVVLPFAIFGEAQLSLELVFLIFLYIYSYFTHDFTSFISGILVVSSMFVVQAIFDRQSQNRIWIMFMAPIGWLLFYVSTFVEFSALFQAVWGHFSHSEIRWQKWQRQGVLETPRN